MILTNNVTMQDAFFLITQDIVDDFLELVKFINSTEFHNIFKKNDKISTVSFILAHQIPVIIGPEDEEEEQDFITTDLYFEVCPSGDSGYFFLYASSDSTMRIEGDKYEMFSLSGELRSVEGAKNAILTFVDDQENHEKANFPREYSAMLKHITEQDMPF